MSIANLNWAFTRPMTDAAAKAVLVALADHADEQGKCWPSIGRLELMTALAERTIQSALRRLEKMGAIRSAMRRGRTTIVILNRDWEGQTTDGLVHMQGGAGAAPPQELHPRRSCTPGGAGAAPGGAGAAPEPSTSPMGTVKETDSASDFAVWYKAFPKHVGRGAALRAYIRARTKASAEVLLAGAHEARLKFKNVEDRYIPHAATWLNQERWLDEPTAGAPSAANADDPYQHYRGID